jgi:hypothetical protein
MILAFVGIGGVPRIFVGKESSEKGAGIKASATGKSGGMPLG